MTNQPKSLSERIGVLIGKEGEVTMLVVHQDVLVKWRAEIKTLEERIATLKREKSEAYADGYNAGRTEGEEAR